MIRITADINIYISAILFGGNPERIINLAYSDKLTLLISNDILAEISYVLRSKFNWDNRQIEFVNIFLREVGVVVTPARRLSVIKDDDTDNRILECAIEGGADYIISGDKRHLLPLQQFRGIHIIDAAKFLKLLTSDN